MFVFQDNLSNRFQLILAVHLIVFISLSFSGGCVSPKDGSWTRVCQGQDNELLQCSQDIDFHVAMLFS